MMKHFFEIDLCIERVSLVLIGVLIRHRLHDLAPWCGEKCKIYAEVKEPEYSYHETHYDLLKVPIT